MLCTKHRQKTDAKHTDCQSQREFSSEWWCEVMKAMLTGLCIVRDIVVALWAVFVHGWSHAMATE